MYINIKIYKLYWCVDYSQLMWSGEVGFMDIDGRCLFMMIYS